MDSNEHHLLLNASFFVKRTMRYLTEPQNTSCIVLFSWPWFSLETMKVCKSASYSPAAHDHAPTFLRDDIGNQLSSWSPLCSQAQTDFHQRIFQKCYGAAKYFTQGFVWSFPSLFHDSARCPLLTFATIHFSVYIAILFLSMTRKSIEKHPELDFAHLHPCMLRKHLKLSTSLYCKSHIALSHM